MILTVYVKPNSRTDELSWLDDDTVRVCVRAAPEKGRANEAVVELLSQTFGVSKSSITLIRGATAKIKQFEIKK